VRTQIVHRLPRHYPAPLPAEGIVLAAPPVAPQSQSGLARVVPLLMPLFGMIGSVVIVIVSRNLIFLIASGCMMVASVGGGALTLILSRRTQLRTYRVQQAQYQEYLQKQSARLTTLEAQQRDAAHLLGPAPTMLLALARDRRRLWERRSDDADFLEARIGLAAVPLCVPLRLEGADAALPPPATPERHAAQELVDAFHHLPEMPVLCPFQQGGILSICGTSHQVRSSVRALLLQLAVVHAPNDLRFTLFFPPEATPDWSWAKWLPHTKRLQNDNDVAVTERLCLLAYQVSDMQAIITTQLLPLLEQRQRQHTTDRDKAPRPLPHLVVVLDELESATRLTQHPQIAQILQQPGDHGLTIICLLPDRHAEPTQTHWRIECQRDGTATWSDLRYGGTNQPDIQFDSLTVAASEEIARALAPLTLASEGARFDMADNVDLLNLLHVSSPTTLRSADVWQARSPTDLLRIPIGKTSTGEPLLLDFKEPAAGGMGPHGMLIGATGSGKSELLRTIVTGLALTHDPTMINFILADFKGGASFADFAPLPHIAGMITNLQSDLTLVDRMRAALFGEQERRQQLLRTSGNFDNIRHYREHRQHDTILPPLPYLFIIVDEFAELLTSRPDFLELFVAIGRVGRSLGMHLLLATQRLGEGRIEGLEGYLRYRMCLHTFSTAESNSVLQTPDAYYLPPYPGVGYCKVETTFYQLFKSALISAPLATKDDTRHATPLVREFTAGGKLLRWDEPTSATVAGPVAPARSVMAVVVDRLASTNTTNDPIHLVWLPPLAKEVALSQLMAGWQTVPLRVPVGVLDDPANQRQAPLTLDFAGVSGHLALVGAPQSGKSTFVQTLIAAFMQTHTPDEVQMYIIDLGGGLLQHFADAPHVGGICFKGERDKMHRLLRLMRSLIEERESFFRAQRIEGIATYRARRAAGEFGDEPYAPDVFLFVDDIGQLQNDVEGSDAELAELAATGLTYGVHIVVTASRWADIRLKLRDNIGGRLEMRLNDPVESEMGKVAAKILLQAPAGRGINKGGMQFQVALAYAAHEPLENVIATARARWPEQSAPPLRLLPLLVTTTMFTRPETTPSSTVMIGLDEFQLLPVGIDLIQAGPHFIMLGDAECGKTNLIRTWITSLQAQHTPEEARISIIDYRRTLLDCVESPHLFTYAGTAAMMKESVDQIKDALEERQLRGTQLTLADLRKTQQWQGPHHYLFIDDYDALNPMGVHPLSLLLEVIQQGRDVGFHVIVARRVGGIGRTATDPVLQRLRELGSPGLVMSGDPQEGPALGTQRAYPLPAGRGYLVRRHQRTMLVQTTFTPVAVTNDA